MDISMHITCPGPRRIGPDERCEIGAGRADSLTLFVYALLPHHLFSHPSSPIGASKPRTLSFSQLPHAESVEKNVAVAIKAIVEAYDCEQTCARIRQIITGIPPKVYQVVDDLSRF